MNIYELLCYEEGDEATLDGVRGRIHLVVGDQYYISFIDGTGAFVFKNNTSLSLEGEPRG